MIDATIPFAALWQQNNMKITYSDPEALLLKVETDSREILEVDFFSKSKYTKLREAWCAAMFGIGYSKFIKPCEVGVNDTNQRTEADFFIRSNMDLPFQLTEVQRAGRERGKEYKTNTNQKMSYQPAKENRNATEWVIEGIHKKDLKNYSGSESLNLVVYVNFEVSQFDYSTVKEQALPYKHKFLSIWLITNTHICSLFSNDDVGQIPGWGEVRSISDYYI